MFSINLYAEEVNRYNVTDEMANPKRINVDQVFYAKLGYGGIFGDIQDSGTNFGFGYRHEMDNLAVDFGFLNFIIGQQTGDTGNTYIGSSVAMSMGIGF